MKLYDFSYGLRDTVISPKASWTTWKIILEKCEKREDLDLVWESKKQFIKGSLDCYTFSVYRHPLEKYVYTHREVNYGGVCFCAPPYRLRGNLYWPWKFVLTGEYLEVLKEIGVITEKVAEEA